MVFGYWCDKMKVETGVYDTRQCQPMDWNLDSLLGFRAMDRGMFTEATF